MNVDPPPSDAVGSDNAHTHTHARTHTHAQRERERYTQNTHTHQLLGKASSSPISALPPLLPSKDLSLPLRSCPLSDSPHGGRDGAAKVSMSKRPGSVGTVVLIFIHTGHGPPFAADMTNFLALITYLQSAPPPPPPLACLLSHFLLIPFFVCCC